MVRMAELKIPVFFLCLGYFLSLPSVHEYMMEKVYARYKDSVQEEVHNKIVTIFKGNEHVLIVLTTLLSIPEYANEKSFVNKMLQNNLKNDEDFKNYCLQLYDQYKTMISDILEGADIQDKGNAIQIRLKDPLKNAAILSLNGLTLLDSVKRLSFIKALKGRTHVALVATHLAHETYQALKQYRNGEISGARAVKRIVHSTAQAGGAIAGSITRMMVGGTIAGPVGAAVGGVFGGFAGSIAGDTFADFLTSWLDLHPDEAVHKAYEYMRLSPNAKGSEINKRYRQLAILYHPDRNGGNGEQFMKLQMMMDLIRIDRNGKRLTA